MTNEELVTAIRAGDNVTGNMALLYQQNEGFISKLALKYSGYAEYDDLMQEAYFGLCDAVWHYDPVVGVKFLTYAGHWLKQAMHRYTQNEGVIGISEGKRQQVKKYKQMVAMFYQKYGREPEDAELRYLLRLSRKQLESLKTAAAISICGLDSPTVDDMTVGDTLAADTDIERDVLDRVQQEELEAVIWPLVDTLPDNEGPVIRMRYQENKTLQEVGEAYGCSIEYVRNLQNKALRDLRRPSRSNILKPFLEEQALCMAMSGNGVGAFNRTWTSSTERAALWEIERY